MLQSINANNATLWVPDLAHPAQIGAISSKTCTLAKKLLNG